MAGRIQRLIFVDRKVLTGILSFERLMKNQRKTGMASDFIPPVDIHPSFLEPMGGYGRIWERMYHGSLIGSGPEVFCVWPYVIAAMRMNRQTGEAMVMLNPKLLNATFGVKEGFAEKGIAKLCEEDEASRNPASDGKRLIHVSGYQYKVVNGRSYMEMRSREAHVEAQSKYRERLKAGLVKRRKRKVKTPEQREAGREALNEAREMELRGSDKLEPPKELMEGKAADNNEPPPEVAEHYAEADRSRMERQEKEQE